MLEYNIENTVDVQCKCGATVALVIQRWSGVNCELCGEHVIRTFSSSYGKESVIQLLALFGIDLTIDFDGQLIAKSEATIDNDVLRFIHQHQVGLKEHFEHKRHEAQQMYVGGSFAGKPHGYGRMLKNQIVTEHIGKKHWEVYESREYTDPRLYFIGRATSEAKARQRKFVK